MRFYLPALAALLICGCAAPPDRSPAAAIERGRRYLWSQQAADGGWHSGTYGLLKSGQSLTPFVLNALLAGGATDAPQGAVDHAIAFVKRNTNQEGAIGKIDPLLYDYPNYATALAVLALHRSGSPGWQEDAAPLAAWLRTQQFTEAHGWKREDAPYGAWGIGGEAREAPYPGHVDLSMTRHVLQALAAAGAAPSDPAFERARVFIERCQNPDGGFFFSTVVLDANKAGPDGAGYRSYGTATADGILALEAIGAGPDDECLLAARRWLAAHDRGDGAPGFIGPSLQRWTAGLRFYYAAAASGAFRRRSSALTASLLRSQHRDGSWRNPENLVKEDDPLIATAFALMALNEPESDLTK